MYFISLFEFECGALGNQSSTDLFVSLVGLVDRVNSYMSSTYCGALVRMEEEL